MDYEKMDRDELIKIITKLESKLEKLKDTEIRESERIKELNCLYGVSKLIGDMSFTLSETLQLFVNHITSGFQYPDITCARLTLNDYSFESDIFKESNWKLTADISLYNNQVGTLEVYYTEKKPLIENGPFLKEEIKLMESLAEDLSLVIERYEARNRLNYIIREKDQLLTRIKNSLVGLSSLIKGPSITHDYPSVLDFQSTKTDKEKLLEFLEVLSNQDRFKIFDYLRTLSLNLNDIMEIIGKSQSTTNHHLKIFRNLGVLTGWKQKKLIFYSINQQKLSDYEKSFNNWIEMFPFKLKSVNLKQHFYDFESDMRDFLINMFSVLGNQERFIIYDELRTKKHSISSLETIMDKSQSTIHHHIQQMKDYELIIGETEGKFTYYTINQETLQLLYYSIKDWFGSITNWVRRRTIE